MFCFIVVFTILSVFLIIRFIGYNNHSNFNNSGEIHFLKKICNENPKFCIDIGANAGNYSKYLLENIACYFLHKKKEIM